MTIHPMPLVRLDWVVLSVGDAGLQVLLSQRKEVPYQGQWGLPGGVLRIDLDTSLEDGAQRVAKERLGQCLPNLEQVQAVGGASRDPRAPWAMSVVYRSMVQPELQATPGKRIQALEWRSVAEVRADDTLAFDHRDLVARAVDSLRLQIADLHYPMGWIPESFTLSELMALSEAVLDRKLDKVTFRRRVEIEGVVVPIEGLKRTGAFRPAQLYRLS